MVTISHVVDIGINLASTLEVCSEGYAQVPKLIAVLYSTTFTLRKIDKLITENGKVFNQTGMADIESLTITCHKIFTGILIMLLELKLRYLLGSVANHQIKTKSRVPGSFDTEISLLEIAGEVSKKWIGHHKHISKKMAIWDKVNSPVPSTNVSSETIAVAPSGTSRPPPTVAPSPPCSVATIVWDKKPANPIVSKKVMTMDLDDKIEARDRTIEKEDNRNRGIQKRDSSLLTTTKAWLKRILFQNCQDEWKHEDLEVWQLSIRLHLNATAPKPIEKIQKLDMSDREIRCALAQTTSYRKQKKHPQLIEEYTSLDRHVRYRIDQTVETAKRSGMREKTWITMSSGPSTKATEKQSQLIIQPEVNILLFFRLGQVPEPINIIQSKGRKFEIPYNLCTSVQMIPSMIPEPGWSVDVRGYITNVSRRYRLCAEGWLPVCATTWETVRRPGMNLVVEQLPALSPINPPPPGGLPPGWCGWRPNVTAKKSTQPRPPKMPRMKPIHTEMKETLQTSYPLFPNEDIFKISLGGLLGLWTNAIDCHLDDDVLPGYWTSSSSSTSSSTSGSDISGDICD
ncbi:hypothetical protein FHETE_5944 [Fusarium heterosporum]|uniref:Ubiquitin-like domain-containing protein n=1 Tax=Fusarium heterosporum TaxID=42747 RepID=A0A8H5T9S9_FUSHE|nr:hypothetical protein FHETE_5944 [Fusarium heterosporum]